MEYPPLAVLPILVPRLLPGGDDQMGYLWRSTLVSTALAALTGWLVWRLGGGSRRVLLGWVVLAVLSWTAIAFRYDIWPVLCMAAGLLLSRGGRPAAAGMALGLGTALKLFPAVLLPVLVIARLAERNRRAAIRLVAGWGLVTATVLGTAWAIAGPESLAWLRYQGDRGLQLESTGASLLLALHLLIGLPMEIGFGYGSVEVHGEGADLLVSLAPPALLVLEGVLLALIVRRFRDDCSTAHRVPLRSVAMGGAALISGLMLAGKVLSFQYELWLVPFIPLLPRRERWIGVLVVGLSTAVFTVDYPGLWQELALLPVSLLVARNGLLAVFLWQLARRLAHRRPRVRPDGPAAGQLSSRMPPGVKQGRRTAAPGA
jgi:hypothetical protein